MKRLKWGVIGCSNFAKRRSIPAMKQCQSVELVAVASRSKDKAKQFSEQFHIPRAYDSYEELLLDESISAVHLPLPNSLHAEWTMRALNHGKHVLIEKPFTTSVIDAVTVLDTARSLGLKVMEAFMWRLHPQHKAARQAIRDGEIGPVRLIRSAFTYISQTTESIRYDRQLGGGSLLDIGCYPVSAARYYLESEPESVFAYARIPEEFDVDTELACVMHFPQGVAMFDCGFHLPYRTDLEIVGENGRIYMPRAWQPEESAEILVNNEWRKMPPCNHYVELFDQFSLSILQDRPLEFDGSDALKQMRALDAIARAIRSPEPAQVPVSV